MYGHERNARRTECLKRSLICICDSGNMQSVHLILAYQKILTSVCESCICWLASSLLLAISKKYLPGKENNRSRCWRVVKKFGPSFLLAPIFSSSPRSFKPHMATPHLHPPSIPSQPPNT